MAIVAARSPTLLPGLAARIAHPQMSHPERRRLSTLESLSRDGCVECLERSLAGVAVPFVRLRRLLVVPWLRRWGLATATHDRSWPNSTSLRRTV